MAGVLTEVSYAVPRDATGGVAALFFDELPLAVWFTLAKGRTRRERVGREGGEVQVTAEVDVRGSNRLNRDLLRRLLSDPEFFERVRRRLDARPAARGGAVVQELDGRSSRRRLLCPIRAVGRIVDVARGEVGRK